MNNEFAVAMSVYHNDSAVFVKRALESIWDAQTVKPTQIVLVVDGPVGKDILDVIHHFQKDCPVLKVVQLAENAGSGNAMRVAMEVVDCELIARMDSDDISAPTRFEDQLRFFADNPDVDVLGGDISEFVGEEENIVAYGHAIGIYIGRSLAADLRLFPAYG